MVFSVDVVRGSYAFNAPSDLDYYGTFDADWAVLDDVELTEEEEREVLDEIDRRYSEWEARNVDFEDQNAWYRERF